MRIRSAGGHEAGLEAHGGNAGCHLGTTEHVADRWSWVRQMIIRRKHKNRFTQIPNAIFADRRLCIAAKGLLVYLLSRPPNWTVRHDQLQYTLGIGRKLLTKLLNELAEAGYLDRDEHQGRDEHNRFMPYDYTVRDIPEPGAADAPAALHLEPQREKDTGNNNKEINTESTNPFPKPLPPAQAEPVRALQDKYTPIGERARAQGMSPVFVGSKPYHAWLAVRGPDGMPGFTDQAFINGKPREIVWFPSVYPSKRSGGSP